LVSIAASEAEGLAAHGSAPEMFGVLEVKMVAKVVVVEDEGAVAALEAIERFVGSLLLSAAKLDWASEAHILVYLSRVSLKGFEVGLDIDWAAQGNQKQGNTEVDLRER